MKRITTLILSIMLSSTALSSISITNPVYQAGSQYTAVLDTQISQWHMVPRIQQDIAQYDKHCHSNVEIPVGLWLLTRDSNGNPELLAPSQTRLPNGHSGRIALISCSDKQSKGLAVPAKMMDWLSKNTSAIYVK